MMVISTAVGAAGAVQSANAQKSAANYNAKIAEQNAVIAQQQTDADLAQQRRSSSKALGDMRAAFSASGVTWEGSPLDVLEDSVRQSELERQNIQYQGELRKRGYANDARLERARGQNAQTAGYMSATSTIFSGAEDVWKRSEKLNRTQ
jgi:hypothetical protein